MNWLPGESDKELDDEIRFHLEMETEKNRAAGMTDSEARRAALRAFGGVRRVQEEVRDLRPTRFIETLLRDVAYAWRTLRRSPAYAMTTIFTLALAVGVCTAMVTFVEAALFRPLPYAGLSRIMTIWETNFAAGEEKLEVSPANFLDWQRLASAFESLALAAPHGVDIPRGDRVISVGAGRISIDYFRTLGVAPIAGRTFEPDDYAPGAEPRVILSETFWRETYGGNRALVGRTIELDAKPTVVLGVVPDGLDASATFEVYMPLTLYPGEKASRTGHWMYAAGRLRQGVTVEGARRDMDRVARIIARENPATNEVLGVRLIPLREELLGRTERLLVALGGASVCLLLLACANIAALTLARGAARRRELAIRATLGARPGRIVRQLATESALLNLIAGIGAYAVAVGIIYQVSANTPEGLRRMHDVHPGAFTIGILLVFTLFATALSGILPAMRLVRSGLAKDLESSRRDTGLTGSEARLQGVLVVAQISIALLLLASAGLLIRSLQKLTANDLGFDPQNVATIQMYLYDLHPDAKERSEFVRTSLDAIRALPGVTGSGATSALPFNPATAARDDFEIVGRPERPGESRTIRTTAVTPGYFETMRVPLLAGRTFEESDRDTSRRVAIINQTAARRFWSGDSPVGSMIRVGIMGPPLEWTIVGVVNDTRESDYAKEPGPEVYVPVAQGGTRVGGLNYVARSPAPAALLDAMQVKIWELTPSQSIVEAELMERLVSRSLQAQRFALMVITGFGTVALLLASTGLFGLLTYMAARRRSEMGIRMALGATPGRIERLFVRRGLILASIGITAGLALSFLFTRVLATLLYQTSPFDSVAITSVVVMTAAVTLLASWIPARRIASLQPGTVLRID